MAKKYNTFAGAKPGSGKNFAKLESSLAARGATNPGGLAAWIGRQKYGKKFQALATGGLTRTKTPYSR